MSTNFFSPSTTASPRPWPATSSLTWRKRRALICGEPSTAATRQGAPDRRAVGQAVCLCGAAAGVNVRLCRAAGCPSTVVVTLSTWQTGTSCGSQVTGRPATFATAYEHPLEGSREGRQQAPSTSSRIAGRDDRRLDHRIPRSLLLIGTPSSRPVLPRRTRVHDRRWARLRVAVTADSGRTVPAISSSPLIFWLTVALTFFLLVVYLVVDETVMGLHPFYRRRLEPFRSTP